MRLDDPDLGLGYEELESIEDQVRAQPHVARMPGVDLGLEHVLARLASGAVDAVRGDDQVVGRAQNLD